MTSCSYGWSLDVYNQIDMSVSSFNKDRFVSVACTIERERRRETKGCNRGRNRYTEALLTRAWRITLSWNRIQACILLWLSACMYIGRKECARRAGDEACRVGVVEGTFLEELLQPLEFDIGTTGEAIASVFLDILGVCLTELHIYVTLYKLSDTCMAHKSFKADFAMRTTPKPGKFKKTRKTREKKVIAKPQPTTKPFRREKPVSTIIKKLNRAQTWHFQTNNNTSSKNPPLKYSEKLTKSTANKP